MSPAIAHAHSTWLRAEYSPHTQPHTKRRRTSSRCAWTPHRLLCDKNAEPAAVSGSALLVSLLASARDSSGVCMPWDAREVQNSCRRMSGPTTSCGVVLMNFSRVVGSHPVTAAFTT